MIDHLLLLSVRRQRKAEAGSYPNRQTLWHWVPESPAAGILHRELSRKVSNQCATAQVQQPTNYPARFVPGASYIDCICDRNAHRLVKALAGLCNTFREPQHQLCAATAEPSDRHDSVQTNAMLDAVFVLRS